MEDFLVAVTSCADEECTRMYGPEEEEEKRMK